MTETHHADGSVDYAMTDRQGSVTYIEQAKKELGDEEYGPSEYSLLLQGADSNLSEALTELHGERRRGVDGDNQNMRLRFSEGGPRAASARTRSSRSPTTPTRATRTRA